MFIIKHRQRKRFAQIWLVGCWSPPELLVALVTSNQAHLHPPPKTRSWEKSRMNFGTYILNSQQGQMLNVSPQDTKANSLEITQSWHSSHLKDHLVSGTQEVAARFWRKGWDPEKNHRRSASSPVRSPGPASNRRASLTDIPREKQTTTDPGLLLYLFYHPKSRFGLRALSMRGLQFSEDIFLLHSSGLRWTWDYGAILTGCLLWLCPSECPCALRQSKMEGSQGKPPREPNSAAKTHAEVTGSFLLASITLD